MRQIIAPNFTRATVGIRYFFFAFTESCKTTHWKLLAFFCLLDDTKEEKCFESQKWPCRYIDSTTIVQILYRGNQMFSKLLQRPQNTFCGHFQKNYFSQKRRKICLFLMLSPPKPAGLFNRAIIFKSTLPTPFLQSKEFEFHQIV